MSKKQEGINKMPFTAIVCILILYLCVLFGRDLEAHPCGKSLVSSKLKTKKNPTKSPNFWLMIFFSHFSNIFCVILTKQNLTNLYTEESEMVFVHNL